MVVERFKLLQPLAPSEITDLFAEIEATKVKENQRGANNVVARVVTRDDLKAAIVDYVRAGLGEEACPLLGEKALDERLEAAVHGEVLDLFGELFERFELLQADEDRAGACRHGSRAVRDADARRSPCRFERPRGKGRRAEFLGDLVRSVQR